MAGYREFLTGEVLSAANVNNFLMEQATMTFADDAARDAALASVLREGLLTYNLDTNRLEVYDGTDWVEPAAPPPAGFVFAGTRYYTSSGNFDKNDPFNDESVGTPKAIRVRAIGGGGGGAGLFNDVNLMPGGGGGGTADSFITDIASLDTITTVTVGAGGAGRTGTSGDGLAGGASSFGSLVIGNGGGRTFNGVVSGVGGGGTGDFVVFGGAGGSRNNGGGFGGGTSLAAPTGAPDTGAGRPGIGPGGGGGGGRVSQNGGNGADGVVIIDVFV